MINKLICRIMGHNGIYEPYKIKDIEGVSKAIIPTHTRCRRCLSNIPRELDIYEITAIDWGYAVRGESDL